MKKDWRTFHKGDLVICEGMRKDETIGTIPAFVYETQTQKNIVQIYALGCFDEWSSSYVDKTIKITDVAKWFELCKEQGYEKDYVLEQMKEFKVNPPSI